MNKYSILYRKMGSPVVLIETIYGSDEQDAVCNLFRKQTDKERGLDIIKIKQIKTI